jgi:ABC-type glycerol-3-phosphate transport system substrate-binding protein
VATVRASSWIVAAIAVATAAVILWPGGGRLGGSRELLFTVWGMPFEDRLFLDRYARGFERERLGARVNYQRYSDDIIMKYNAWHARGRSADVMRLRITDYPGMAARGLLKRLDGFIADPEFGMSEADMAQIPGHLRSLLEVDGPEGRGIYALPADNAQYGLFYNRAIFRAHNAANPDAPIGEPDGTWTWDDLRRAASALTRRDDRGEVVVRGIDFAVWSWPFMTLFAQAGGELWSADGAECMIDSSAGVEALRFMRALAREDGSWRPQLSGYLSGTGPDVLFARGRTAMFMDGSWRVADFDRNAPGLEYAVVPLARGPERLGGRDAIVSGSVLWGVGSNAPGAGDAAGENDAWMMVRWLVSEARAIEYWDTLRLAPPAHLGAMNSAAFRSTRGILRNPDDASEGFEVAPMPAERFADRAAWLLHGVTPDARTGRPPAFVPVHRHQAELEQVMGRMLNEFLSEESRLTPEDALRRAAAEIRGVMDRDRGGE